MDSKGRLYTITHDNRLSANKVFNPEVLNLSPLLCVLFLGLSQIFPFINTISGNIFFIFLGYCVIVAINILTYNRSIPFKVLF